VNRSMQTILSRTSWNRPARRSEAKHGLFLDGAPQPLRADRFGYNIDMASEDIADASGQRIEVAEIRKAPGRGFGAQANSQIHVRTLALITARDRPEEGQTLDADGSQLGFVSAQFSTGGRAFLPNADFTQTSRVWQPRLVPAADGWGQQP
jgi:hypothetical protein